MSVYNDRTWPRFFSYHLLTQRLIPSNGLGWLMESSISTTIDWNNDCMDANQKSFLRVARIARLQELVLEPLAAKNGKKLDDPRFSFPSL